MKKKVARKVQFDPDHHCGARTRAKTNCVKVLGERTEHQGVGRCWLHGGATPIKTGIYSKQLKGNPRLKELIQKIDLATDNLEDLRPEVILLKALVAYYVENFERLTRQADDWHASHEPIQQALMVESDPAKVVALVNKMRQATLKRPRRLPDPVAMTTMIDRVRKMAETIHRIRTDGAMPRAKVLLIIERLAVVVAGEIPAATMKLIETKWRAIPE